MLYCSHTINSSSQHFHVVDQVIGLAFQIMVRIRESYIWHSHIVISLLDYSYVLLNSHNFLHVC